MMGTLTFDLNDVVTKTTGGLIILPYDHYLVTRKTRPIQEMHHIGKSACDQCSYCTDSAHATCWVMRCAAQGDASLGSHQRADLWNQWSELCCACGCARSTHVLRTCYPKEACDQGKQDTAPRD